MKTKPNRSVKITAAALLVTLFMVTILAVSIGGYLTYIQQQSSLGTRAQTWNVALSISEAGIEEGLQQINNNDTHLSADGWSQNGALYSMTRTFANGNYYTVTLDDTIPNSPIIISKAFVNPPSLVRNAPTAFLATVGVDANSSSKIGRGIRVTTTRGSLFLAAMVAKHKIDMNGNNVMTDSFDSGDSAKSTNGRYDVTKAGDKGDVASNDGVVNAVNAGNANIYGHVYTGPSGTAGIGSQGAIGEHSWQAGHEGAEDGWVLHNANFTFPDTSLPYNNGLAPVAGDIVTITGGATNVVTTATGSPTPPGTLAANQFLGPVTTNKTYASSSIYPGAQSELTTNTTWITTNVYPGSVAGLVTNCIGFTTVGSAPGQQSCLTTNSLGTTNSAAYPGPISGLSTNTFVNTIGTNTFVNTTTNKVVTTTTNSTVITTATNRTWYIVSSNAVCGTTAYNANSLPANACSYTVQGNGNGASSYRYTLVDHYNYNYGTNTTYSYGTNYTYTYGTNYTYTYGTNYTYNYSTNYTYTYPAYNYTYANQFSYTYQKTTYTYASYTYDYVVYQGVIFYATNHYDHVLLTGDYYTTQPLTGTTYVSGNARLVMPNGLNMSSGDTVTIDPNASLKLFSGGTDFKIAGNGVINETGFAGNFIAYCTTSVTSFTLDGNAAFVGILVAPNAHARMNGSGNPANPTDFTGAIMVNSVTMNGHFNFHYDEALSRMGGTGRFLITSWDEIPVY